MRLVQNYSLFLVSTDVVIFPLKFFDKLVCKPFDLLIISLLLSNKQIYTS